jgi:predicted oxidoreductase (fatty acid repression mutant protein)
MEHSSPSLALDQSNALYNADFYAWTQEQVGLLQQARWNQLDVPNLVEEIQSFRASAKVRQQFSIWFLRGCITAQVERQELKMRIAEG